MICTLHNCVHNLYREKQREERERGGRERGGEGERERGEEGEREGGERERETETETETERQRERERTRMVFFLRMSGLIYFVLSLLYIADTYNSQTTLFAIQVDQFVF